jgi:hypothetical protein
MSCDLSWAFERSNGGTFFNKLGWSIGKTVNRLAAKPTLSADDKNESFSSDESRRSLVLGSAAFLSSTLMNKPAQASNAVLLEESEKRRIDTFENNAPSVVFIDTFAQKQDVFSPNSMEVPIGSGSGFVWDKEGHIGK